MSWNWISVWKGRGDAVRLHRLSVTAFGPFAGTEEVDFDRLSAAGLFLMHGPTGAGKTTVLDAVCFALYGRVPGARSAGARLRSDHAAEGAPPEVVCEFSVGERRLELTRSPEWQRPKRRGTGTTREPARAMLRELRGGTWEPVTNRADEAGELVQRLLGLGAEQFTKLVLLPQGEFAAFLRASAEDRRTMLQRLFGTERFDEVERWLSDRRRELAREVTLTAAETSRLLARAAEAVDALGGDLAGDREPGSPDDPRGAEPAETGAGGCEPGPLPVGDVSPEVAADAVSACAARATAVRDAAAASVREAAQASAAARSTLAAGREVVARHARRIGLEAELAVLVAGSAEQAERRRRLEAGASADVLSPFLAGLAGARDRRDRTAARLASAKAAMGSLGDGLDPDADVAVLQARAVALREELGIVGEALRVQEQLALLSRRHERQQAVLAAAVDQRERHAGQVVGLEARARELTDRRATAELVAAGLPDRERDVDRAADVAAAVLDRDRLAQEARRLADAERTAVDSHQAAQQHLLDLRERRLAGMAAELAARLADGDPCPVCGAVEHPTPAEPGGPPVTDELERMAREAAAGAESRRRAAQAAARAVAEELSGAAARAGDVDAAGAAQTLRLAVDAADAARQARAQAAALDVEIETVTAAREVGVTAQETAAREAAAAAQLLAELAGQRDGLRDHVDGARGDDVDLAARHARLRATAAAVEELLASRRADAEAQAALADAVASLERAATAAGFEGLDDAVAAVLPEGERLALRRDADGHEAALARTRALLADIELVGAPDALPGPDGLPDLDVLADAEQATAAAEEQAAGRLALASRAADSLRTLARLLARHATATAPLRRRYAVLDAVSRCADGTGGDNAKRMRLSAYVLAARLEEVAAAASGRLLTMSGGRYSIVHTDDLARGGARSGLGLAVVDGWTGVQRDTCSLSGGETFYASLALALGLADVVQAEAGGTAIDTLLVDEGFGSLDADTLDEVMDTLDGLRSGGRAVGLVSHVADLRDRIPAQLEVVKTRSGSRLHQPVA